MCWEVWSAIRLKPTGKQHLKKRITTLAKAFHPANITEQAQYLLKDEAISGKFIIGATLLALLAANTALASWYESIWSTHLAIGLGEWVIDKDVQHWINDALMAIFFLVVGLELKRELVRGELRKFKTAILPFAAAIGGMIVPALLYVAFNIHSGALSGWAIPMATDIAFAIGILALLGNRIPASIRLFLLTLAIVDDIGAVIVITVFYSQGVELAMLGLTVMLAVGMFVLSRVHRLTMFLYALGCVAIWLAVNASGVHASIAGVIMGLLAPMALTSSSTKSVAERTEHFMIPISTFMVVPLFALANTGIALAVTNYQDPAVAPIAAGIIFGLVVGKVVGIVGASWLMVRFKFANLPEDAHWNHMVGVGLLAGIGFTVSIFVTELAFDQEQFITIAKLSIFIASAISAVLGLMVLRYKTRPA